MATFEFTELEVEEPLSPAARLFHQPTMNCHIIAVLGMGKKIDVEKFIAGLESTLAHHPRFSSVLVSDERRHKKPTWVRTKVMTKDHVVVPEMVLGAATATDKVLEDYLSSLSITPMDPSRPLWDFHLLNIRTSDAEAVAVLRVHHSLGDGVSLISLLLALSRKISDPGSLPTVPAAGRQASEKHRGIRAFVLRVWAIWMLLWHTIVDVMLFAAVVGFSQDTKTLLKGTDGVEFRQKKFVHRTVSLDDVKTIKNSMGCTVTDVLVGVTSAGLSRYLSRSFDKKNVGKKKKGLPANILIRTTLMVNIRKAAGIHTIAEMMKGEASDARWGNCLGLMVMPLAIVNCKDPLDYIRKGKAITERKKNSLEAPVTHRSSIWISKITGDKFATKLMHRVVRHTTLCFSSVFGPVEEISLFGHPLTYIAPSIYGHPQALTLHFQSYAKKLTIVAAVDELSIPDPHQLLDDLAESLKLIKDTIVKSSQGDITAV